MPVNPKRNHFIHGGFEPCAECFFTAFLSQRKICLYEIVVDKLVDSRFMTEATCTNVCSRKRDTKYVVYEADPSGYGLYRDLVQKGFECMVCAPSLIPKKPDERVKTDRRDALKRVRALRAGDLSAVHVPDVEDEAYRDLARAWATAKADLRQARQRLKSFLLAHGVRYAGHAYWGSAYRRWVSTFAFPNHWQQLAFDECPVRETVACALTNIRT
jgi:transposase